MSQAIHVAHPGDTEEFGVTAASGCQEDGGRHGGLQGQREADQPAASRAASKREGDH